MVFLILFSNFIKEIVTCEEELLNRHRLLMYNKIKLIDVEY